MPYKRKLTVAISLFVVLIAVASYSYFKSQPGGTSSTEYQAASVLTSVKAREADSFIETIGIVTHLYTPNYNTNSSSADVYGTIVKPKLRELGVRYIRDGHGSMGTGLTSFKRYAERLSELSNPTDGSAPIGATLVVSNTATATANPAHKCFAVKNKLFIQGGVIPTGCGDEVGQTVNAKAKIVAFENANEPDHCFSWKPECQTAGTWYDKITAVSPNWISDTLATAEKLYTVLKADPLTQSLPILAPSYVHLSEFSTAKATASDGTLIDVSSELARLDAIKQWVSHGNVHPYCSKAQSSCIISDLESARNYYTGKKLIATEYGWPAATPVQTGITSEAIQAKYLTRGLFTHFDTYTDATGSSILPKSYSYELLDEESQTDVKEKNFGIVKANGTPKAAYTSLKNVIALLGDRGSSFTTGTLDYAVATSSTSVRNILLQKRDQSFWLVVYNDIAQSTDADVTTPATLLLDKAADVTVYVDNVAAPIQTLQSTTSVSLAVPDRVMLIKIVPGTVVSDPLPTPAIHAGDIDASTTPPQKGKWGATVTFTVHDADEQPVGDAVVYTSWIGSDTKNLSCKTSAAGTCNISLNSLKGSSVTVTITKITKTGFSYLSAGNHDPDGSGNGTRMTIPRP